MSLRLYRYVVVALTAALAVSTAAGCGGNAAPPVSSSPIGSPSGPPWTPGDAAIGDAPTPTPTPKSSSTPARTKPPVDRNWPYPPDCISYDPDDVTILKYPLKDRSGYRWLLKAGNQDLHTFGREADADKALVLAKSYRKLCFVGRNNTRSEPERYTMEYWLEPVAGKPSIPSPDCLAYSPSNVTAVKSSTSWTIMDDSNAMVLLDTEADAKKALLVLRHYNRHCFIGRAYTGPGETSYVIEWFTVM